MKNLKIKKTMIILFTVLMLVTISTRVLAVDADGLLSGLGTGSGTSTGSGAGTESGAGAATQNIVFKGEEEEKPTTSTNTLTGSTNKNKDEKLPQTGDASDYIIFAAIGVCLVVSIVAYRKVREYNNI